MSHGVLDIVAEHPEEQHVAEEVKQRAVEEDVGDERQLGRHEGKARGKDFSCRKARPE